MKTVLFGVILGLFAVVHSTPENTVTQILAEAEGDALREAMTDGFLVEESLFPSLTTAPPKVNTTVQASRSPLTESQENGGDLFEGSAAGETHSMFFQDEGEYYATTHPSSTSTAFPDTVDSIMDSPTSQTPLSDIASSLKPDVDTQTNSPQSTVSLESEDGEILGESPAQSSRTTSSSLFAENEGSGSGMSEFSVTSVTSSTYEETSTESSTLQTTTGSRGLRSGIKTSSVLPVALVNEQAPAKEPAHSTPEWIIIVGFVVGIAALVLLTAAITTKDKWRGPKRRETKTKSSRQQTGVEMETFLHQDVPRENGKAAEYTVIPLDELPDKQAF